MAQPTKKVHEINALLSQISGRDRETTIQHDVCTWCGARALKFRDKLSEKEYIITGMCQACQDSVFGQGGEDD